MNNSNRNVLIDFTLSDLIQEEKQSFQSSNQISSITSNSNNNNTNTNTNNNKSFYYELKFTESNHATANLEYITFKNYYTSSITIMAKLEYNWKYILTDYKLMENSDCEEDAERVIMIHKSKLTLTGVDLSKLEKLRIFIMQPSLIFLNFKLYNFKLFTDAIYLEIQNNSVSSVSSPCLVNENSKENDKNSKNLKNNKIKDSNPVNICLNKYYLGNGSYYLDKGMILNTDKTKIISNMISYAKNNKKCSFKIFQ
jgi:hypothetical protein